MEILEFTEVNPVLFKIKIKVDAEAIQAAFQDVLTDLTKDMKLPGFRPGKAPRNVVQRHVGSDELWRMARDRASELAFGDALEQKNTSAASVPNYEHTDYMGEGDYEFTAHFYTQPPSPQDILKHAMKPDGEAPNPEDHLPEAMREPRDAFGGMKPGPWSMMDHDHIVSGDQMNPAGPEITRGISPDGTQPQLSGDQQMPVTPGVEGLPGNPQMQPSLPGNIGNVIGNPGDLDNLVKVPIPLEQKAKPESEPDVTDTDDNPKTSKPFKLSEDSAE